MVHVEGTWIMNNAEWMIKNGMSFENLHIRRSDNHYYEIGYYVNDYDRICNESEDAILEHGNSLLNNEGVLLHWLQSEHHEQILDDVERRYLSAVIRPFRNRVTDICKVKATTSKRECLIIHVSKYDRCGLPWFEGGAMYKGMEVNRHYTLEELGL